MGLKVWLGSWPALLTLAALAQAQTPSAPSKPTLASAGRALVNRDYGGAKQLFTSLLAQEPGSIPALLGRGTASLQLHAVQEARADFESVLKLRPQSVSALLGRGITSIELGRLDEAQADFEKVLSKEADNASAYVGCGSVQLAHHNTEQALAEFDQALRFQPACADAFVGRGVVHLMRKDDAMALADYDHALKLDPENIKGLQGRGCAHFRLKDFQAARFDLERAAQLGPEDPEALNRLAWLLAVCSEPKVRDSKKAIELARKACDLAGNRSPHMLDTLAAALAAEGDFAEATQVERQVLKLIQSTDKENLLASTARLKLYEAKKSYQEP
jgi:tetratricopeptide (TPR) repeat protein